MTAWLFTIERELDYVPVGQAFDVWTEPPRLVATGEIRRRGDGNPYTPTWLAGEEVVVFHPGTGRCVALLELEGPAEWDEAKKLFFTETVITALSRSGPTLADIGVARASQGGRERLSPSRHGAAVRHFRLHEAP